MSSPTTQTKATRERVFETAEKLSKAGIHPSVEKIRQEIDQIRGIMWLMETFLLCKSCLISQIGKITLLIIIMRANQILGFTVTTMSSMITVITIETQLVVSLYFSWSRSNITKGILRNKGIE